MVSIHIYMHICYYVITVLLDIGIEFEISYIMYHLHLVSGSLYAMLHCHMTLQIVYSLMPERNLVVLMFP